MILTHMVMFGFFPGAGSSSAPVSTVINPSQLYIGIAIRICAAFGILLLK